MENSVMEDYWIENIYNSIKGFSDINKLKERWFGLGNPNEASYYGEDIAMLYDDNCFDDFIVEWEKNGMDKNTLSEMIIFRDMLNAYDAKIPNAPDRYLHLDILNDPEWFKVVAQAGKVIEVWKV